MDDYDLFVASRTCKCFGCSIKNCSLKKEKACSKYNNCNPYNNCKMDFCNYYKSDYNLTVLEAILATKELLKSKMGFEANIKCNLTGDWTCKYVRMYKPPTLEDMLTLADYMEDGFILVNRDEISSRG